MIQPCHQYRAVQSQANKMPKREKRTLDRANAVLLCSRPSLRRPNLTKTSCPSARLPRCCLWTRTRGNDEEGRRSESIYLLQWCVERVQREGARSVLDGKVASWSA